MSEQPKFPFSAANAVLFGLGALFRLATGRDEISGLDADRLEIHGFGKGFDFLGLIADSECNVM